MNIEDFDPVHIDSSHPCIPHLIEAADALAEAARTLRMAKYGFSIPLTGDPSIAAEAFEKIMHALEPIEEKLAAYEKARGLK